MKVLDGFTIGALSKQSGVNVETIRYYEKIGIMPMAGRNAGGYRIYGQNCLKRLTFVRRARELGFSIEQIRALLALAAPTRASCADVREIARTHLDEVRAKLADLARLEHILAETIARCSGEPAPSCPVLDMLATREGA